MARSPDIDAEIPAGDGGQIAEGTLPAAHGVVLLSRDGDPVLALAASNLKDAVAKRLAAGEPGPDGSEPHEVFDRVRAWRTGSSFEADLKVLDVLAEHLPEARSQARSKLTVWWLRVDRGEPWRGWTIADEIEGPGESIGPFLDRSSARRWSELLDGEFDLCRVPAELRHAPRGTPCSYKDMGLCRATCEGGEPMPAYDIRLGEAVRLTVDGARSRRTSLDARMREASGRGEFELASVLRDRLEALPAPGDRLAALVAPLERFAFVAVARGIGAGRVRLLGLNADRWRVLGEVDGRSVGPSELKPMIAGVMPSATSDAAIAGVVAREVARPRRGGPAILRTAGLENDELLGCVRRAAGA